MDWKRGLGKGGNYYQVTTLGGKFISELNFSEENKYGFNVWQTLASEKVFSRVWETRYMIRKRTYHEELDCCREALQRTTIVALCSTAVVISVFHSTDG